jgi:hypothetical protein
MRNGSSSSAEAEISAQDIKHKEQPVRQTSGWLRWRFLGYVYLYGPEAVWKTVPSALVGSGGTIYVEPEKLATELHRLLGK